MSRRFAFVLVCIAVLFALGCDGSSPQPSPTATAVVESTATISPTTTTSTAVSPAFLDFVRTKVVPALDQRDYSFFKNLALTQRIISTPENTPPRGLGGPDCQTVGEQFDGFGVGRWQSEGSIVSIDSAIAQLQRLSNEQIKGASDKYGDSTPRVYAVTGGPGPNNGAPYYSALVTALIKRPDDFAGSGPLRVVIGTTWQPEGDGFRLASMLYAYVLAEGLLDPSQEVRQLVLPGWQRFQ